MYLCTKLTVSTDFLPLSVIDHLRLTLILLIVRVRKAVTQAVTQEKKGIGGRLEGGKRKSEGGGNR